MKPEMSTSKTKKPEMLLRPTTPMKPQQAAKPESSTSNQSAKSNLRNQTNQEQKAQLVVQNRASVFNFECPSCHSAQKHPVSLCKGGHLVCPDCKAAEGRCRICKRSYTEDQNKDRGIGMDMVYCSFALDGCKKILQKKDARAHRLICDYRPIPCFATGCEFNPLPGIRYSQFTNHFMAHKGRLFSTRTATVTNAFKLELDNWVSCRWIHAAFEFRDFTFFVVAQKFNSLLGIWLWILGSETDAKMFRVKLVIGHHTSAQYKWDGPVHSIRKKRAEIMTEATCFLTSWDVMKNIIKGKPSEAKCQWNIGIHIYDSNYARLEIAQPLAQQSGTSISPSVLATRPAFIVQNNSTPKSRQELIPPKQPQLPNSINQNLNRTPSPFPATTFVNVTPWSARRDMEGELAQAQEINEIPRSNDDAFIDDPDFPDSTVATFGSSNSSETTIHN
jgi:hypothetical protein